MGLSVFIFWNVNRLILFVLQYVSVDEATHLGKLRKNDKDVIHHMERSKLLKVKDLQAAVRDHIQHTILKELEEYGKTDDCIMTRSSSVDMENFSLKVCLTRSIWLF